MNCLNRNNSKDHRRIDEENQLKVIPEIKVNIILGMPSKKCQYHGICRIEPIDYLRDQFKSKGVNKVKALLQLTDKNDLAIKFRVDSMTDHVKEKHFDGLFFMVFEVTSVPDFVSNVFGHVFSIQEGKYEIIKKQEYYEIVIPR